MRTGIGSLLMVVCCGMFLFTGCAKEQMVKKDGEGAPAATEATKQPAKSGTAPATPDKPISDQPIREEPVKVADARGTESTTAVKDKTLQRIHFDYDAATLSPEARDILYKNAEIMLKNPRTKYQLEGHCDERGSDEYNLALGERRAKAANSYLLTLGVPAEQLSIISYGKEKPLDPASTEEAWAKNRRVEFVIIK
jgi:peptidoglycan-associated lipoprotein